MEEPGRLHINPQSRWENPSLQNAISLPLVLGGSLLEPAAKPGRMMKHCLLPPLLTVLQGAPGLCQHFLLLGMCLNFPPASILTVSPGTVVPFDSAHPSQQCLMWTQPICLRILPTSLVKSWCSAACPACPLLADPLSCTPISVHWREMSSFQPVFFSTPPVPCPGFTVPSFGTKFHHPTVGSFLFWIFFFSQAVGMRKPMNQPYYGFMCIPCFPNGHPEQPLSICCYSALLPPNMCQPPLPSRLVPEPAPILPKKQKTSLKKGKAAERKPSAYTTTDTLLQLLSLIFLW